MYDKVILLYISTIFTNSSSLHKLLYIIRLVEKLVKLIHGQLTVLIIKNGISIWYYQIGTQYWLFERTYNLKYGFEKLLLNLIISIMVS